MSKINDFLLNTTVIDVETTGLLPDESEIVEIAASTWNGTEWVSDGMLLGAVNGISPSASARNNISNRMISGLPTFSESSSKIKNLLNWSPNRWYVTHNVKFDAPMLTSAWKKLDDLKSVNICNDKSRWICTLRLAKHLLEDDYPDCEYSLNYLRYLLDLPVPDNIQLHRATNDTYLCGILLNYLIAIAIDKNKIDANKDIGKQLNEICWSTIIYKTYPFGKYRGELLTKIPNEYYIWSIDNMSALDENSTEGDPDLIESVKQVLETRITTS